MPRGVYERRGSNRGKTADIRERIKEMIHQGFSTRQIAKKYNLSCSTISNIHRDTWGNHKRKKAVGVAMRRKDAKS